MKSLWKSKTFWVNAFTFTAGLLAWLVGQDLVKDNAAFVSILVAVQGVVNIALRLVTTKPIGTE